MRNLRQTRGAVKTGPVEEPILRPTSGTSRDAVTTVLLRIPLSSPAGVTGNSGNGHPRSSPEISLDIHGRTPNIPIDFFP